MTTVVLVAWVVLSVPVALVTANRLGRRPAARALPARLSPRAELPSLERVLLVVGLLAGVVLALTTRDLVWVRA